MLQRLTTAPSQAQLELNPVGLFNVSIPQNLGEQIGGACGVTTQDVFQLLAEDNAERQANVNTAEQGTEPTEDEIIQSDARFELESEDGWEAEQEQ